MIFHKKYYNDYPTKPIGGGNPYSCCSHCGVSCPSINGELKNHYEWCEYRRGEEREEEIELLKLEIEVLKLELNEYKRASKNQTS